MAIGSNNPIHFLAEIFAQNIYEFYALLFLYEKFSFVANFLIVSFSVHIRMLYG